MDLATTLEENPAVKRFQEVAKELDVVIPVSFFERAGNAAFNSIAIIDADGTVLGKYRKTHIPDGMPYAEKFFFTPGDTGFKVWKTKYATIGVGICWDQWFPGSKTGDVWYAPDAWMLKTDWIRKVLCGAANICLTCEGIVCRWQSRM